MALKALLNRRVGRNLPSALEFFHNYSQENVISLGLGFEKDTPTHTFQLFVSTYNGLIPQQNLIENQTNYKLISQFMLGFNITVRFY